MTYNVWWDIKPYSIHPLKPARGIGSTGSSSSGSKQSRQMVLVHSEMKTRPQMSGDSIPVLKSFTDDARQLQVTK